MSPRGSEGRAAALECRELSNGLRVNLLPDPSLPLVTVNLWYHVGSKNERPGRTGLAHLFEHMLFQGSENVGTNEHFRWVQQAGGVANGSTWYDRTNYFETLPAHQMELGLWLESDRMGFLLPALDEKKLETQRQVVINERRERVDNQPYGAAMEKLHELLYREGHPYRWPVIGYMEDIAAVTLDEVQEFFSAHYTPGNAVLSLVGDFSIESACDSVEKYFGDLSGLAEPPPVTLDESPSPAETRCMLEDRVALARLYTGYRVPAFGSPAWYAADLLAELLAGGKASPLYRDLVQDRQLAQDVSAYVLPTELEATFLVIATARPGIDLAEIERRIEEHLTRLREGGPDPADLERAVNAILTSFAGGLQSFDRTADLLSQSTVFFDDPARIDTEPDRYRSVTSESLRTIAGEFLLPEHGAIVTVVPAEAAPDGAAPGGAAPHESE